MPRRGPGARAPHRRRVAFACAALALGAIGCGGGDDEATLDTVGGPASAKERSPGPGGSSGKLGLERIGSFDSPVYLTQPPGSDDLYVVERGGVVKILRDGDVLPEPFWDVSDRVATENEQGLL